MCAALRAAIGEGKPRARLRLRLERQLGYKMAKYIMRIEAVESFRQIADVNALILGRAQTVIQAFF
jgi:hypothetical protein